MVESAHYLYIIKNNSMNNRFHGSNTVSSSITHHLQIVSLTSTKLSDHPTPLSRREEREKNIISLLPPLLTNGEGARVGDTRIPRVLI
jgi:hypothetical protein